MHHVKDTEPNAIKEHQSNVIVTLLQAATKAETPKHHLEKHPHLFQKHGRDNPNNRAILEAVEWAQIKTSPSSMVDITKLLVNEPILRQAMEWNAEHMVSDAFRNILYTECTGEQKLKLINALDHDPKFLTTMLKNYNDFAKQDHLVVFLNSVEKSEQTSRPLFERLQKTHFWKQWPDNEHKWDMASHFDRGSTNSHLNDLGR